MTNILEETEINELANYNNSEFIMMRLNNWLSEESKQLIKDKLKVLFDIEQFTLKVINSSSSWKRLTNNGNIPHLVVSNTGDFHIGFKGKYVASKNSKNIPAGKIYFKDILHKQYLDVAILRVEA